MATKNNKAKNYNYNRIRIVNNRLTTVNNFRRSMYNNFPIFWTATTPNNKRLKMGYKANIKNNNKMWL